MATVKKSNVPPTHPTVWVGLGLAAIGLLIAIYAYTGSRVYDVTFAIIAALGGLIALVGILVAAWGRSVMASRAQRSRRATFTQDALAIAKPSALAEEVGSETMPTIAAPSEKKRFSFSVPKRAPKKEKANGTEGVFAFRRKDAPQPQRAADDPRDPAFSPTPMPAAPEPTPLEVGPVRATLKCPQCAQTFTAEGVRPFEARCTSCGFASSV